MSVVSMVVGAVTPDGATFVVKVDGGGPVRVAVSTDPDVTSPAFTSSEAVDAQGVARVSIAGLDPSTRYWWRVEDDSVIDEDSTGQFLTHPPLGSQASFTIAVASCAGKETEFPGVAGTELSPAHVSNHPVFDTIRERALSDDWLFFAHLGDLNYYNPGSGVVVPDASLGTYRAGYDDVLAQPLQQRLYRELPWVYVWDDNESGPGNWDRTFEFKANAAQVYRERVPHYALPSPSRLSLPGASGDYASTPDHASLDITGDLDIRVIVAADTWTPAGTSVLVSKYEPSGNQRSYRMNITAAGLASIILSPDGTATATTSSTVPVPFPDGQPASLRVTVDVDNGSGGHTVTFYTGTADSLDGPWTQLGDPVVNSGTTNLHSGTAALTVGAGGNSGTTGAIAAKVRAVQVRNGIDGTVVANPDFSAETPGTTSFADSTGKTWTVNGSAAIEADPGAPIYQQFQVGRVQFVVTDTRYNRSPNGDADDSSKTMLGPAQKAWLLDLLSTTTAEALVILTQDPWIPTGMDTWGQFRTEQAELVDMLSDTGWLDRTVLVHGDRHVLGVSSGASNDFGGFPVMCAASLDATNPSSTNPAWFDVLPETPGRNQYGTVGIRDAGSFIGITLSAWRGMTLMGSYTHSIVFPVSASPLPDVTDLLSGSVEVRYEARVLETFQTGDDPVGTELEINDGQVEIDWTREVRSTASLRIPGTYGQDGPLAFPRGQERLLAPFGNEVFIRYGYVLGGEDDILWVPLGYFRINKPDQDDAPFNPISLDLDDRMATIIDSELMAPREYAPPMTVGDVFDDLILEIYPDAVIVFDDATGDVPLGRQVIADESRYKPLKELADSYGKIFYWDTLGVCRITNPPDPERIAWVVKSGRDGVLINANRSVTREEIYNAVIVEGEGADDRMPVRAIAVNADPASPLVFGGRFGRVPYTLKTPLVTTQPQAVLAATRLLQRAIGAPFSVEVESVVNASLRPGEAILIIYSNNDRDVHIVDSVTISLDEDASMDIETRINAVPVIAVS